MLDALGPLMEFPGAYVFGSNDYYGPKLRNPARYLIEKAQGRHGLNGNPPAVGVVHNPWEDLRDALRRRGLAQPDQHPRPPQARRRPRDRA